MSWSGFPFAKNSFYYYKDFSEPPIDIQWSIEWGMLNGVPEGCVDVHGNEVKNKIEKDVKFKLEEFNDDADKVLESANEFKNNILIELISCKYE